MEKLSISKTFDDLIHHHVKILQPHSQNVMIFPRYYFILHENILKVTTICEKSKFLGKNLDLFRDDLEIEMNGKKYEKF